MNFFISFLFGSIFGSFFGLVIDRLPAGKSIVKGSSHCENCQHKLQPWELIPIFSQILSKNHCRHCGIRLSLIYPFLEFSTGICFSLAYWNWLDLPQFLTLIFCLILSILDYRSHQFPFVIWLFFAILFLFLFPWSFISFIWILLAGLAEFKDLKIGTGDFLWIFIASFSLSFIQIIWVIQIASFLGICYFFIKKLRELPFIPFLSIGYLILLLWDQIH
jgi:leader peptidase (prepilin peptidase)/N-methyltransferase